MVQADAYIRRFGEKLRQQYGFLAEPYAPVWQNVQARVQGMPLAQLDALPRNLTCHNLLTSLPFPSGTRSLLGLGLNYCLVKRQLPSLATTFARLREDVRRIYALKDVVDDDDGDYIPSLYIKSDYKFVPASDNLEQAIDSFERALTVEQRRRQQRTILPNLTPSQGALVSFLRKNDKYIVFASDKGLGPCIGQLPMYGRRAIDEHLGNATTYRRITDAMALSLHRGFMYKFESFFSTHYTIPMEDMRRGRNPEVMPISHAEAIFLRRARKRDKGKLARFRMTAKIHKTPWVMRPIVATSGTFANDWSKWLHHQLAKLEPFVESYLADTQGLLDALKPLHLPPNARLFTADARSMYTNIDTRHAIQVISSFMDELEAAGNLPDGFPIEATKNAMSIIMTTNIFEFGDLRFLQLVGTAMGTPAACAWATLYFGWHENQKLLPTYQPQILFYRRFIDDVVGIWACDNPATWTSFCQELDNFGILRWDVERPSLSVDFMDVTLTIRNGSVESTTFQKKRNLYLYLPPASAHPAGTIKGTIYGLIGRYFAHNTHRRDFLRLTRLLFRRLLNRGWDASYLTPVFLAACRHVQERAKAPPALPSCLTVVKKKNLFLHLEYHRDDVPRTEVRRLYEQHLGEAIQEELGLDKPIVAYSRPTNLGDLVTQAKFHEAPGFPASFYMGESNED